MRELSAYFAPLFSTQSWALLLLCYLLATGCSKQSAPPVRPKDGTATKAASTNMTKALAETSKPAQQAAIFEDDLKLGRDPFFPNSPRRQQTRTTTPSGSETRQQAPERPLASYLRLSGIWSKKDRPLALINRTTFAPGEQGEISISIPKPAGASEIHTIRIRCLEIRDQSVIINIEGESGTRELKMADKP